MTFSSVNWMEGFGAAVAGVSRTWAAVIIAVAMVLSETQYFGRLIPILGGGAAATLIVLGECRPRGD